MIPCILTSSIWSHTNQQCSAGPSKLCTWLYPDFCGTTHTWRSCPRDFSIPEPCPSSHCNSDSSHHSSNHSYTIYHWANQNREDVSFSSPNWITSSTSAVTSHPFPDSSKCCGSEQWLGSSSSRHPAGASWPLLHPCDAAIFDRRWWEWCTGEAAWNWRHPCFRSEAAFPFQGLLPELLQPTWWIWRDVYILSTQHYQH